MPERENFMKLRSSKAAIYTGAALVCLLMPVLPDVVVAKTTYEQQQSTKIETELKQVSYTENVADIVATGYEENIETDMYEGMAIAIVEPYINVFETDDEASQVVGRMYNEGIASVLEVGEEWTKISSGGLTGFIKSSALCFGDEAEVINSDNEVKATVTSETAAVYLSEEMVTASGSVTKDDTFTAIAKSNTYVIVKINDSEVYMSLEDVAISYGLENGYTSEEAAARDAAEEAARKAAEEERKRIEAEKAAARAAKLKNVEVTYNPTMDVTDEEVWLLATVVSWESGNEPYEGKLAVANVVLNRVRSNRYPSTITGVIYQRSQFSGVSDGAGGPSTRFKARLEKGPSNDCIKAAKEALSGVNNIGTYLSFRSTRIAEYDRYASYTVIGSHVFY